MAPAATRSQLALWRASRTLKHWRARTGKTQEDVVEAGIVSDSTLSRIENRRQLPTVPVALALGQLYDAPPDEVDHLVELVKKAKQPGWWEDANVPDWFGLYLELENEAELIEFWHSDLVNGLFQTEDYARAVFQTSGKVTPDDVEDRVKVRLERQETVLERSSVTALLGEGATRVQIGSPDVMRDQLDHLRVLSGRPNVDIGIVPWTSGAHARVRGPYTILTLGPGEPDVAYVETLVGASYFEEPPHLAVHREIFHWLHEKSVPLQEWSDQP
jgi:transcriptional regulator with XRE-family HTH domain